MKKQTQDILWASLSKEERKRHRDGYKAEVKALSYNSGFNDALESIFGSHNLTSDTEPEEMLMVERKRVQELYDGLLNEKKAVSISTPYGGTVTARLQMLQSLFGDKCLPDKPSVQVEPKFKVGELAMNYGKKCRILEYNPDIKFPYLIHILYNNLKTNVSESDLETYTEPETKDMEEKELDIYELLQDCSDVTTIYSVVHDAEVDFKLSNGYIEFMGLSFYSNGSMYDVAGRCMLYPSRALYEKYPLDAYSAWMEWKEARKPKVKLHVSYEIIQGCLHGCGDFPTLEFYTDKEAHQATEAVRECLMKFQESLSQSK